jgi:hypothetical protein
VAATSPLALASVLVVLTGAGARLKGAALAVGFVAGQTAFLVLGFAFGAASAPDGDNHPNVVAALAIAFGLALLLTAVYVRRHRADPPRGPHPRTVAIRTRLANLRPLTALGSGLLLGIGGPKRITVTLVVSATIAASGSSTARAVGLGVLYIAVATVLVWAPVLLYILFGERATDLLTRGQVWISRNKEPLTFFPSAVLGTFLVVDGIVTFVR